MTTFTMTSLKSTKKRPIIFAIVFQIPKCKVQWRGGICLGLFMCLLWLAKIIGILPLLFPLQSNCSKLQWIGGICLGLFMCLFLLPAAQPAPTNKTKVRPECALKWNIRPNWFYDQQPQTIKGTAGGI